MKKFKKITKNGVLEAIKAVLSSKYYPFIIAAVSLLCYYLGWDLVAMYFLSISGILMLILLDDVSPIISVFLFTCILVSLQNTPSLKMGNDDLTARDTNFYFKTENAVQIVIIMALSVSTIIYRIVRTAISKKFTVTPIFWGLVALSVALLFSGLFSENYSVKDTLFGLLTALGFFGLYCAVKNNVNRNSDTFEKIAYGFLAFSLALFIELIVAYITTDGLFENGNIYANRGKLVFGWGVCNTLGAFMVMCIPSIVYLAGKTKFGFILTAYSVAFFVGIFMSCSKQAMIGAVIVYAVCVVLLLIKGKYRIPNICIFAVALTAAVILIVIFREKVFAFFKSVIDSLMFNDKLSGSGRVTIWKEAINYYRSAPLFGAGFYVKFSGYTYKSGLDFFPYLCHNTVFQIMCSCGTIGIIAYAIHRIQTVICYWKNRSLERTFIALTVCGLLIVSLMDTHLFNVLPTIIYSCLIGVLDKTNESEPAVNEKTE